MMLRLAFSKIKNCDSVIQFDFMKIVFNSSEIGILLNTHEWFCWVEQDISTISCKVNLSGT